MSLVSLLVFVVFLVSSMANAQATKDPIDQSLDACLNSLAGASTVGQTDCADKAYAAWDAELNKVYQKLMKNLDPASRDLLRTSQRQWLAFQTSEKKFQAGPWRQKGGTLIGVSVNLDNVGALRSRVMSLRTYAAVAK
jgi:uncharacterized protein YecT (DUF1311 family)